MKLPRSAVWGIPGSQHCKAAIELLRSAVWQRDHRTAEVCSLSPRKKVWIELPALAVWWSLWNPTAQTADLSSFMAALQSCGTWCPQTADLGSFMAGFQSWPKVSIKLPAPAVLVALRLKKSSMLSNCRPWQFYGHFTVMHKLLTYLYLII